MKGHRRLSLLAWWLLLVAIPMLWGLSYFRDDCLIWNWTNQICVAVGNTRGQVWLAYSNPHAEVLGPPQIVHLNDPTAARLSNNPPLGGGGETQPINWMGIEVLYYSKDVSNFDIALPHWLLSIIPALSVSLMAKNRWRLYQRRRHGLCLACGYDLRGSAGRCPECGMLREPQTTK